MATRFSNPTPQFFYQGTPARPLTGGLMYFYVAGNSLTPKNTYSDNTLSTANSNPVVLSSSGVLPNVYLDGAYRVILKDKDGVQQWDRDSVNSISELSFAAYDATINYGIGGTNIVYASNGFYYVSIDTPNTGNEPSASPLYWQLAIDYFLESQTTITAGHIGVGGDPDGIVSLNTATKGTIAVGNDTTTTTLAVGTDTHVLTADSAQPKGIKWAVAPGNARDYQEFTSSGTWTKPDQAEFVLVELWGGGGGGGANTGSAQIGGGSGGEYVYKIFQASDLSATESVTIGAGGAGSAGGGPGAGSTGGTTTFGSLLSAVGGNLGTTGANFATTPRSINALAATASTGVSFPYFITPQSGYGGSSSVGGKTIYGGGGGGGNAFAGGTSEYGGNGGAGTDTSSADATAGTAPGGGGGGAGNGGAGGAGARGEARVWTW